MAANLVCTGRLLTQFVIVRPSVPTHDRSGRRHPISDIEPLCCSVGVPRSPASSGKQKQQSGPYDRVQDIEGWFEPAWFGIGRCEID